MHITKVPNSYDDYKMELSWSELKSMEAALSAHHSGVIADEAFARMQFYMARIPGPGEEKEKGSGDTLEQTRAKEELGAMGQTQPSELKPEDVPMPPGHEGGEGGGEGEDLPLPGGEVEKPTRPTPKPEKGPKDIELEDIPMPRRPVV